MLSDEKNKYLKYKDAAKQYQKRSNQTFIMLDSKAMPYQGWIYGAWCVFSNKAVTMPDEKDQLGFKFHISLSDSNNAAVDGDENLAKGCDIASQTLQQNKIWQYKVARPGLVLSSKEIYQSRKQMTIYSGMQTKNLEKQTPNPEAQANLNKEYWEPILDEIVLSYIDQGIKPQPTFPGEQDVHVKGSDYITYRNDTIDRGLGLPYKNAQDIDIYKNIRLSDICYRQLIGIIGNHELRSEQKQDQIGRLMEDGIFTLGMSSKNFQRMLDHLPQNPVFKQLPQTEAAKIIATLKAEILLIEQRSSQVVTSRATQIANTEANQSYSEAATIFNRNQHTTTMEHQDSKPQWEKLGNPSILDDGFAIISKLIDAVIINSKTNHTTGIGKTILQNQLGHIKELRDDHANKDPDLANQVLAKLNTMLHKNANDKTSLAQNEILQQLVEMFKECAQVNKLTQ